MQVHNKVKTRKVLRAQVISSWGFDDDEELHGDDDIGDDDELEDLDGTSSYGGDSSSRRVDCGLSFDDLAPSIVESDGPARGMEVLELGGVGLDQGDDRLFLRKFIGTQVNSTSRKLSLLSVKTVHVYSPYKFIHLCINVTPPSILSLSLLADVYAL